MFLFFIIVECRGNSIVCTIATASLDNFPPMVDPETGIPTGENWAATNVEYGWSARSPLSNFIPGRTPSFDYPVSLYLRMFRFRDPSNPSPLDIRVEDIEYEFFEMSNERYPNDFDISLCYRALNYEYIHLVFTLQSSRTNVIDRRWLNRRDFMFATERALVDVTKTKPARIADVEIDHEISGDTVQVFFTLLGQTPMPGSPSGVNPNEPTAAAARDTLEAAINGNNFKFDVQTNNGSTVQFMAVAKSLKYSNQYISTHSAGPSNTVEKYSSGAQAAAIIVGLLIGLIIGVAIAAGIRIVRKEPMPSALSFSNPLPSINFKSKTTTTASTA